MNDAPQQSIVVPLHLRGAFRWRSRPLDTLFLPPASPGRCNSRKVQTPKGHTAARETRYYYEWLLKLRSLRREGEQQAGRQVGGILVNKVGWSHRSCVDNAMDNDCDSRTHQSESTAAQQVSSWARCFRHWTDVGRCGRLIQRCRGAGRWCSRRVEATAQAGRVATTSIPGGALVVGGVHAGSEANTHGCEARLPRLVCPTEVQ